MPRSDGHMTGLSLIALREAGISALDPRIQHAIKWIDNNQRATGRWWTSSLNTERLHLITYSATAYALLSLWKCNALSRPNP
jgi:squalene-hopene/tetraprenyl-beta-curcumene cyclase